MKIFAITFFVLLPFCVQGGVLNDKTPGYFVDRYGSAKSSNVESAHNFVHQKRGSVKVKGQFSTKEFKKGDLRVYAVFYLPSLRLAAVRLQLDRAWTKEQIEAALAAYGGEWAPISRNGIVNSWVAPDGTLAISMLTWLEIQSKTIVEEVEKSLAADVAKRKAIPKF